MLWYKAWMETRSRFLISLIGMVALCAGFVFHLDRDATYYVKDDYYYYVLFVGNSMLVVMWLLAVTLTMMGGLLREKASGTSAFTLALPVSRARLATVRICTGFAQALALAIIPWITMLFVGSIAGKTHSISQAAYYLILLLGGGMPFFAMAVLVSSLITGEYTAPVVSFGVVIVTAVGLSGRSLRPYSPWAFMTGREYLNEKTNLLSFPIPWLQVSIYIIFAGLLLALSVRFVQQDADSC
jgi:ABC-type transport system involved in multi-copper enzyme maturation permease subunit